MNKSALEGIRIFDYPDNYALSDWISCAAALFVSVVFILSTNSNSILANDKSQLEKLNPSTLFVDESLENLMGIYGLGDSWFNRVLLFRQSPYNSLSVKYNNVVINNIIDGSWRNDLFIDDGIDAELISVIPDMSSNSMNLTGSLILKKECNDSSLFRVRLQGGNIFGNPTIGITGKSGFLKWGGKLNYLTSSGFDLSASKPDSLNFSRANSSIEKLSACVNLGIDDKRSSLLLSVLYNQSKQEFPISYFSSEKLFVREPDMKFNLFDLEFTTLLNTDFRLNGNFFFTRSKSIFEKYDSQSFQTFELEDSFVKSFEESKYGWNSNLVFAEGLFPAGLIAMNYSRENLSYQPNRGFRVLNYSFERLTIGTQLHDTSSVIGYILSAGYKIINPLTTIPEETKPSFSDFEYAILLNFSLNSDIQIKGSFSRKVMLPSAYLIYPEINNSLMNLTDPGSTICNGFEITANWYISENNYLKLNLFKSDYINVQLPFGLIDFSPQIQLNNYNSTGLELYADIDLKLAKFILNSSFYTENISTYDFYGRELMIPKINILASLWNSYNFGLTWSLSARIVLDRKSSSYIDYTPDNFYIFNFILSQKVLNDNSLFIKVNNFTDHHYEIYRAMPMPGISFVAGIILFL